MNNQDPTIWEKEINAIELRSDEPKETDIVFIGSSSIRKWTSLKTDFSEYIVVNHGFGGSKIADATYYYARLVTNYHPKVIVIFSGKNNIHGMTSKSESAEDVFEDFKAF